MSVTSDLLSRVDELIGSDIVRADEVFAEELVSWHPYVTDVIAHVTRFRGKRLRPMLLLLTAKACGGIKPDHHVLAAVVEMIHTATLVHDDVLDDAETRRHVATVNSRWNNETSVLCGDYLFTHSFHLAASLDSARACRLIGKATNLVCEGELCQVHERANIELDEEQYFRIINGKTAELCALCSHLGAIYADADETVCESLREYARQLGMAFQIADDLLDILGNEEDTGKSLGTDYIKQKLTLPLIRFRSTASPDDAATIRELLETPTPENRVQLMDMLHASDAVEYAANKAREFADGAIAKLNVLPDSPSKSILAEMAEFACSRTF